MFTFGGEGAPRRVQFILRASGTLAGRSFPIQRIHLAQVWVPKWSCGEIELPISSGALRSRGMAEVRRVEALRKGEPTPASGPGEPGDGRAAAAAAGAVPEASSLHAPIDELRERRCVAHSL